MVAHHLGTLHGYEQALALGLAFGPFVLLAIVVLLRRRQDAAEDAVEDAVEDATEDRR